MVTGVEPAPRDGRRNAWDDALRAVARSGARIVQCLVPGTGDEEAATAQALADEYPRCECMTIANVEGTGLEMFYPRRSLDARHAVDGVLRPSSSNRLARMESCRYVRCHQSSMRGRARSSEPAANSDFACRTHGASGRD